MLMPGMTKLIDSPAQTFWVQGATRMYYQGSQFERRDPLFTVAVHDPNRFVWSDIESRFRMALGMYDQEFVMAIKTHWGTRRLSMRLLQEPTAYTTNEAEKKWAFGETTLTIPAAAAQPFWVGDPWTDEWENSGGTGTGSLVLYNQGDVPTWPQYEVTAPGTWTLPDQSWGQDLYFRYGPPLISLAAEDAGRDVALPALVTGEDTSVDTDPDVPTLIAANGAPVQNRWGGNGFLYPIAAHTPKTACTVLISGGSTSSAVTMTIPQWFSRPWGVMK